MTFLAWSAERLVRAYQIVLRPVLPPACRFVPSCSEYARQALVAHGFVTGLRLALLRLLKCHPLHPGGYDPPPARQAGREED